MSDAELNEEHRLKALSELSILDTPEEPAYSEIVAIAASLCGTTISLVSLIDADRQWFKANVGLKNVQETSREVAFCAHTIQSKEIFEVCDASADPRFSDNPLVTGHPDIRFYAGAPLRLSNGAHVGSLCVIDSQPKRLTSDQRTTLTQLAATVVRILEARYATARLVESEAKFRALSHSAPLGIFSTTASGECTYTNERLQTIFGISDVAAMGFGWTDNLHPDDKPDVFAQWNHRTKDGLDFDMSFRVKRSDNSIVFVRAISRPVLNNNGDVTGHIGSIEDITERKVQLEALSRSEQLLAETGAIAAVGGWQYEVATEALTWAEQTFCIHELAINETPSLEQAIAFYTPEAQLVIADAVSQAMSEGRSWDLELPMVTAKNKSIWVRSVGRAEYEKGTVARVLGTCQNITTLVTQRQALETAHDRISIATESGDIGVWDWNIEKNAIDWTPQMFSIFGMNPDTKIIHYAVWINAIHPDDRAATEQYLQNAIQSTADTIDTEFRILWPDGSVHHIRSAAKISRKSNGAATHLLGVNWDVTPLRELTTELAEQHELLHVTLQSIGDAVITTDTQGRVTWLNPVAEHMTGWSAHQATDRQVSSVFNIVNETSRKPALNLVKECLNLNTTVSPAPDTVLISRTGSEFGVENSAAPIHSKNGDLLGAVLVFHDVTEQRRLSNEMRYRAMHDALTGLVNRTEFEHRLQVALTEATEHDATHSLIYIDLDQFKLVNDTCGHSQGDRLLIQIAKLLFDAARVDDTVARIGGDEFALILNNHDAVQAKAVAQRICDTMDEFRFMHNGRRFRIGTSIGLVPLDYRWDTIAAAMQAADVSCYAAKGSGGNRVHVWYETDIALKERQENTEWATRIEQALDEELFELHAQRIHPLYGDTQQISAEILIRMRGKAGLLIYPDSFIGSAERFNLATHIDRWVLNATIDLLAERQDLSDLNTLFINLSGQSVGDKEFHSDALTLLAAAGSGICRRLCLEITETAAITNIDDAAIFVQQVRKLGVKVALDDFGAGASSFGYLKKLKVDLLKIDGQFIEGIVNDPLDSAAVRCFVDVAQVMGVATVAEYVSDPDILVCVKQMGVDYAQGFHLHKPEPVEHVLWKEHAKEKAC